VEELCSILLVVLNFDIIGQIGDVNFSTKKLMSCQDKEEKESKKKAKRIIHAPIMEKEDFTKALSDELIEATRIENDSRTFLSWSSECSDLFKGKRLWGLNTGHGLVQKKYCHRQINLLLGIVPKEFMGKDNFIFYDYLCYTFRRCLSESKTLMLLANYDEKLETGTTWKPFHVKNHKTPILILWNTGLVSKEDNEPLYCALAPYISQSDTTKTTNELYLQFFHKESQIKDQEKLKDIIGVHILDFTSKLLETQNPKTWTGKLVIPSIEFASIPQRISYFDSNLPKDLTTFNPKLSVSSTQLKDRSNLNFTSEQLKFQLNCTTHHKINTSVSIEKAIKIPNSIVPFWNFKTNEMNFLLPFYSKSNTCKHAVVFALKFVPLSKKSKYFANMIINLGDAYHRARKKF
jgi:hypothetical protein